MKEMKKIILCALIATTPFAMTACQIMSDEKLESKITDERRDAYLLGFESGYNSGYGDGSEDAFIIGEINGTFKCTEINGVDLAGVKKEFIEEIYGPGNFELDVWGSKLTGFNYLGSFDCGNIRRTKDNSKHNFEIYINDYNDKYEDTDEIINGYLDIHDSDCFEIHYTEEAPENEKGVITAMFERTGY